MGGRGGVWRWWDYVAVNIRLRKEEEEALRREGNDNDGNGYRGKEGRGGGKKGTMFVEWSLSWYLVSFTVTILYIYSITTSRVTADTGVPGRVRRFLLALSR